VTSAHGPKQLGFFDREAIGFDAALSSLRREHIGHGAWLDYAQNAVRGQVQLFEHLARSTRWHEASQQMYDKTVATPRLYAVLPDDGPGHPVLEAIRSELERRYGERFPRLSLALYRDGRDSVAWHGDRVARRMAHALVATVSVGGTRRFLLRPYGGGPSLSRALGHGDLLVMGGTCQRTWQHAIPKVPHAEPRIAIMFRPIWDEASG
jgi:alkylated DNA repair dioxygenase AlkB